MNTNEIKKAIWTLEYYNNGLNHISGAGVKVTNLKVRKTMATTADVTLTYGEGERTEKYKAVKYDLFSLGNGSRPRGTC